MPDTTTLNEAPASVEDSGNGRELIEIVEQGLHLTFEKTDTGDLRWVYLGISPPTRLPKEEARSEYRLVELQVAGENCDAHHGAKYVGTEPGRRLVYGDFHFHETDFGKRLDIRLLGESLEVTCHFQFFSGLSSLRCWTTIANTGPAPIGLTYVSSFALTAFAGLCAGNWESQARLSVAHNSWHGECQWQTSRLPEMGLRPVNQFSLKRLSFDAIGTWSADPFLPMGCLENTAADRALTWQIEHNGSWHWEVGERCSGDLYLQLSGPTENEGHWYKELKPGECFDSVPVAVAVTTGGLPEGLCELTRYRRRIRRPHRDNTLLPIAFNDYMNCLGADPTTEKEMPLIEAAAEAGCEYYVIDAGWYGEGYWWDSVGEWKACDARFPGGGLRGLMDYIRSRNMVPGLWLELEVVGINSTLASRVPDDWFFVRHGKRVVDHGRYQLDFRNPDVVSHADDVIRRVVQEYGAGYIKMDYNINAGVGTELDADSFGDGLLQHNRAYLRWLDTVFERYPDLVIENCGSGGLRMDYALLSRHSVQSISDQTDFRKMAVLAAAGASAVTPEQCGVWAYPLEKAPPEDVVFNMVNAMLLRIHLSGRIDRLEEQSRALVHEGLAYYRAIRSRLPDALPVWPLGLPGFDEPWIAFGLRLAGRLYLAVWRMQTSVDRCRLPLDWLRGLDVTVRTGYPAQAQVEVQWDRESGVLEVSLERPWTARLLELTYPCRAER